MPGLTERRNSRLAPWLYSRAVVVNILRMLWASIMIWGEFGIYLWSVSFCKWPDSGLTSASHHGATHVLLISDPQIHKPSIFQDESSWSSLIKQLIYDVNLKKSWRFTKRLQPHVVFFLGDLLASGRGVNSETEYVQYIEKFTNSFPLGSNILAYYIPGNEDVGMGVAQSKVNVRRIFAENFGPFTQQVEIHDHTFVLLDAPGLVDEDYQRASVGVTYNQWSPLRGGTVEQLKKIKPSQKPLMLLSHIPLYRKDTASCGPLREKGNIHKGVGHGYQNTLGKETTNFLLESLRPSLVISGDNRDYCEHTHVLSSLGFDVPEVTVKSFSNTRHISNPGFQLLSLGDPPPLKSVSQQSFSTQTCLLPGHHDIYGRLYPMSILLTVALLFIFNAYRARRIRRFYIPQMSLTAPHDSSKKIVSPIRSGLDSAIWTPGTGALTADIRTPNMSSRPTFRSASRPATPLASSVLPVTTPLYNEEEEADDMYPAQYAQRATAYPESHEETWSHDHEPLEEIWHENSTSTTNWSKRTNYWKWSWSFNVGGRRVTVRVPTPSWSGLRDLVGLLDDRAGEDATFKHRGMVRSTLIDLASVGWTCLLLWSVVTWWTF
ncbi:hypothetical protein K435DRAFT_827551 [Dendrothele bispora CBS 962.96]|uniref:Calcineurin-like phosphoesterase domain-containing protein n=1 Tax=Dendrothele bispora (strain CBS 962.96) TaxID=1314807 RepID=A0A4S8MI53_DENBC|nr:hypothetical protein K435DRAFT_827551 [Dendrothele bispora CBS 962.96]